jgi:uncharacterized protein (TIGR02284 family)
MMNEKTNEKSMDKEIRNEAMDEKRKLNQEEVIAKLNGLIETCKDGQEGFQTAAEGVNKLEYKNLLKEYSSQRAQFVGELQAEVRRLGGGPAQSGTVGAALHRGWINIKSVVTGKDENAILAECERGEESAIGIYEETLKEGLTSDVAPVVERQYHLIRQACERIRGLERVKDATA